MPGFCTKATRSDSPRHAASASLRRSLPRYSYGRCMRTCLGVRTLALGLVGVATLVACSTEPQHQHSTSASKTPAAPAPASQRLVLTSVKVPGDMAQSPLDQPRQALVPEGWTMAAWARVPKARMAVWTPDGALLVSVPATGQIVKLTPKHGAAPQQSILLGGLDQPHGMAFAGSVLYIAESDQIDTYDYADGKAGNQRTIAAGLPDQKSPELHGAYAHALKSIVVGPDGAVYFSIGSTGNISTEDREASPPRASIMRIPPGGGPAEPF